jgi:3-(3-hydroxy-phenyl)propionate hydroxylase
MNGHAVVIAGGDPAGLMLAGELAQAGADAAIVERRASQELTDALTTWFGPPADPS